MLGDQRADVLHGRYESRPRVGGADQLRRVRGGPDRASAHDACGSLVQPDGGVRTTSGGGAAGLPVAALRRDTANRLSRCRPHGVLGEVAAVDLATGLRRRRSVRAWG